MDRDNRPRGREKHVTSGGTGVYKRGDGLNTGPVGESSGYAGRKEGTSYQQGAPTQRTVSRGKSPMSALIAIVVVLAAMFGGGSNILSMFTGGDIVQTSDLGTQDYGTYTGQQTTAPVQQMTQSAGQSGIFGTPYTGAMNTATLNRDVAPGSRDKYTSILGNKQDVITMMVFMCGTDLESRSKMASSDLMEMLDASFGDNINLLIYTGGCSRWQNNVISNRTNQIYQVKDGQIVSLVSDIGAKPMVEPNSLTEFITFCSKNFPANRNMLIFWDHGGGSVSGYGYDEKYAGYGSMDLAEINTALKNAGVKFDMIGFDACLMATLETGLMLNEHADYLLASEETEPGIGWFYTNWLTELGKNTSMPTIELGKNIIDEFTRACAQSPQCRGQKTTLSIIDLAELSNTVPEAFSDFAKSISDMITEKDDFSSVSNARYRTREFAQQTRIDQVDLVDLANKIGNSEGKALADKLTAAVKYNRTSNNMTNAYGVSIYFPYQKAVKVDSAVNVYDNIGIDTEYSEAIREFAALQTTGQISAGGTGSAIPSLFGTFGQTQSSGGSSDMILQMLGTFMGAQGGGGTSSITSGAGSALTSALISGLTSGNTGFLSGRALTPEDQAWYVSENYFDPTALTWTKNSEGDDVISLADEQWDLVQGLDLNLFYDDGEGYIDLGLDNVFTWDNAGNLVPETDRTWLSIDGHPVAYYHLDTTEDEGSEAYTITGRVPAFVNEERVNLLLAFDDENPEGYIIGSTTDYNNGETETVAKVRALEEGDEIQFICDYYGYDMTYQNSYLLGDPVTYHEDMLISNTDVGDGKVIVTYRFTDIYNQEYWTEALELN